MLANIQLQDFEIDNKENLLTRQIEWCGDRIDLNIELDIEDNIHKLIFIANELVQNQAVWDNNVRNFVAKSFLDSANKWRCGEGLPFTLKDIMNILYLHNISIQKDGNFCFLFDDSIIFKNHSTGKHYLNVEGNLKEGFYEVDSFSY